jgi:hypothetical protein
MSHNELSTISDDPGLTVTVRVPLSGNVSTRIHVNGTSSSEAQRLIDRAITALQAERAAYDRCPYHAKRDTYHGPG